jgi:hypothetical protein
MIREFYVIIDGEDTEVNFYDIRFPNAKNRAILCARQVDNSVVIYRKSNQDTGEREEKIIWSQQTDG